MFTHHSLPKNTNQQLLLITPIHLLPPILQSHSSGFGICRVACLRHIIMDLYSRWRSHWIGFLSASLVLLISVSFILSGQHLYIQILSIFKTRAKCTYPLASSHSTPASALCPSQLSFIKGSFLFLHILLPTHCSKHFLTKDTNNLHLAK
jgi:cellulose synthase/poly-beta-1,6-N-acetylglucosamine synthase-like glycosyltransferase